MFTKGLSHYAKAIPKIALTTSAITFYCLLGSLYDMVTSDNPGLEIVWAFSAFMGWVASSVLYLESRRIKFK